MELLFANETIDFLGGGVFFVTVLIIGLAILAFEIWMIVDAIQNPRLDSTSKALWVVGMILLHPIVGIIYFFTARRRPPAAPVA